MGLLLLALASGMASAQQGQVLLAKQRFEVFSHYELPANGDAVAIGDITGDGRDDLVVTTASRYSEDDDDNAVYLFVQQPDSLLQIPWRYSYEAPANYTGLALADFNRDGRLDVVVGHGQGLTLLINTGDPENRFVVHKHAGPSTMTLAVTDFDRDGVPDVATVSGWPGDILLYLSDGNGGIRSVSTLLQGLEPSDIEFADMNGDRVPDLVVGARMKNAILMYPGRRGGGLASTPEPVGAYSESLATGDFNHDGRRDVLMIYSDEPSIYYQLPGGGFGPRSRLPGYSVYVGPLAVADLNRDGRDDVVMARRGWSTLASNVQTSNGTFDEQRLDWLASETDYNRPHGMAVGDLNHDGCADVAVAVDRIGLEWLYGESCRPSTDLAIALGFNTTRVAARLNNAGNGLAPVASPRVEFDLTVYGSGSLAVDTLPADCRLLSQTAQHARVACARRDLLYGAQDEIELPIRIASPVPTTAFAVVTGRTTTLEVNLHNNRAAYRLQVPASPSAAPTTAPRRVRPAAAKQEAKR